MDMYQANDLLQASTIPFYRLNSSNLLPKARLLH